MPKNLVIVESPAKAKTIAQYLGKDFEVKSSFGHVRDLPKKGLSIDIKNNFKPDYEISPDKKEIVKTLKKEATKADKVWLASDEDREGEAIAWHLSELLGLTPSKTHRIVFHEITKNAIMRAVENPRKINMKLVDAQQARRILDRLVGYELSPVLWKKVRPGISAGRVQSVAVRLIVEREREINKYKSTSDYKVTALFDAKGSEVPAELSNRLSSATTSKNFLEHCKTAKFTIENTEEKQGKRSPGAPFTTSSLQQEAARQLGFSVKQTMVLAQRLYESGHITYMRTDSTILSDEALENAKKYITKEFGEKYHYKRQFKTKQSTAQEAHEAIRPTHFTKIDVSSDQGEQKLYNLIWRRALASQMADSLITRTEITINISGREERFTASGEILNFDGFMKVYGRGKDDVILPKLEAGQELKAKIIEATETFSKPSARYSEASLVRKLEALGIGRPSTYAPTISTIQSRGYVEKSDVEGKTREKNIITLERGKIKENKIEETYGADKNKLLPTPLADVTTDFLTKNFGPIVDYKFTARAEEDLDEIANGKEKWVKMLENYYKLLHPLVKKSEDVSREESTQTKQLGIDPKTKKPIFVRYGRYGPMIQRGESTDEEKPDFAPIPVNKTLETVTFEDALEMFKLPRVVGRTKEGEDIESNIGRFGPYIKVGKVFVSIKDKDPLTISETEARGLYEQKKKQLDNKYIQEFKGGIKIVNGPYGPYVTNGKKNAKIPEETDAKKITLEEAKKLIEKAPARRARRRRQAKA